MDAVEHRINAYEMALIEVVAFIEEDHVVAAVRAIRSAMMIGMPDDERTIRMQAIDLLERALARADIREAAGLHWQGEAQAGRDALRMLRERLGRRGPLSR